VTLIAEAGLGKSRLLGDFQHRLASHAASWWLLLARSQPSGLRQPYGLLRDMLARRLEIADSDSADVARAKLVQGLAPWLDQPNDPPPRSARAARRPGLLGQPAITRPGGDARLLRERALAAWRLHLERLAAARHVVLLLDGVQWADDASPDAARVHR
jgi:hypothetical protein